MEKLPTKWWWRVTPRGTLQPPWNWLLSSSKTHEVQAHLSDSRVSVIDLHVTVPALLPTAHQHSPTCAGALLSSPPTHGTPSGFRSHSYHLLCSICHCLLMQIFPVLQGPDEGQPPLWGPSCHLQALPTSSLFHSSWFTVFAKLCSTSIQNVLFGFQVTHQNGPCCLFQPELFGDRIHDIFTTLSLPPS